MSQHIVLQAIKSLLEENKTPSLALVKHRVSQRLPMPALIEGLNAYKRNPDLIKQLSTPAPAPIEKAEQPLSNEARIDKLEAQLAALLARVAQLESEQCSK